MWWVTLVFFQTVDIFVINVIFTAQLENTIKWQKTLLCPSKQRLNSCGVLRNDPAPYWRRQLSSQRLKIFNILVYGWILNSLSDHTLIMSYVKLTLESRFYVDLRTVWHAEFVWNFRLNVYFRFLTAMIPSIKSHQNQTLFRSRGHIRDCRFVLGCPFPHPSLYNDALKWPSLNIRRHTHWYHLVFKCIHFNHPPYLQQDLVPFASVHSAQLYSSDPHVQTSIVYTLLCLKLQIGIIYLLISDPFPHLECLNIP